MIEREARPMKYGVGSIPVVEGITLTADELRTWEALYLARGDMRALRKALGVAPTTAKNKLIDLYAGLHVNQRGCPKTRACVLAFYLLDRAIRQAERRGIEWRRGPRLEKSHPTKRRLTMQEALAS